MLGRRVLCALCCIALLGGVFWLPLGDASAQVDNSSGGGVVLAVANGESFADVGVAAALVASGEADALVIAAAADVLGDGAAGVFGHAMDSLGGGGGDRGFACRRHRGAVQDSRSAGLDAGPDGICGASLGRDAH
ncbi:hypothetical protein [Candidatus Poriferisodalis sp.]|uniref:hypothetical protein n=1 Tax=Candidatus Poriferisodalis sp. TaxID=3101277 RepID=UPI003B020ACE